MKLDSRFRRLVDDSLWLIPSAMVIAAIGLSLVTTLLDDAAEGEPFTQYVFTGGADSARAILQTVAAAVITFTGLVFTITVIALQLSSQQFSPRVLRTFLRDRLSKFALGMFVSTFIYSLMVLRVVSPNPEEDGINIPSISMMVLLVMTLGSVAMFVSYISHMTRSIRVSDIVAAVGDETRDVIARVHSPDEGTDSDGKAVDRSVLEGPTTDRVIAPRPGSLTAIDHEGLVELAANEDIGLVMTRHVGDFVAEGQVVAEVKGGRVDESKVWKHLFIARERTMEQDVKFGIRQLVDVAEKALSPSMNDPTTAVMAIDQIHDVMRRLAGNGFPPAEHTDDRGVVRLAVRPLEWEAMVELAFSEIRLFSGQSLQVTRRIMAALDDLEEVALAERKEALRAERRLLEQSISDSFDNSHDRELAGGADQQGVGSRR